MSCQDHGFGIKDAANETYLHSSCLAGQTSFPRLGMLTQFGLVDHKHRTVAGVGWLQRQYG
jgi:hypothetical protein